MEDQMSNDQQVMLTVIWTVVATLAVTCLSGCIYSIFFKKRNISSNSRTGDGLIPASTAAASLQGQNYEVFLNFRGKDNRRTFTDHLYRRLVDVGVSVFRDNEGLHVGEEIHPNLLRAIQSSKISIPIISPNYASSKWCLRELVQILKCRETSDQIVIPILYHVHPSDVRHQTGSFGKAFSTLKKNNSDEHVQHWKKALKDVAALKVLELNDNVDGYEGELVKKVVEKVLTDLNKITMVVPEYLVGVEEQAGEIMDKLDLNSSNGVQLVLIHGMSGIGKTTLAKFLYNQLSNHFRFCSFLESIRETPIQQLQKQLISNILKQERPRDIYQPDEGICIIKSRFKGMKVLLVLDDVDRFDELNALIERYDYFGPGSIVIITSQKIDVLNPWHVDLVYELKGLDFNQSLRLFCKHALQREYSHLHIYIYLGEFETVGRRIISTMGGLPLAIKVVGSFLSGKGLDIWKETLNRLERMPNNEVLLKLKISYDALSYDEKKIFLDIACLFPSVGNFASFKYMWDDCGYYPLSGIEILKSKSFIKIESECSVIMHNQLRLLGREIIRQESPDLPGILWDQKEACEVIKRNQVTQKIEVLNLASNKRNAENCFTSEQFVKLPKLRFLQINNANLNGNFENCFLNLRWLEWNGCPSNFMATGFCPKNLVVLNLSKSNITEQWGGWNEMKYAEKLKVLKLNYCSQLKATPDFSTFKELEILELRGCKRLRRIDPSISGLTKVLRTFDVANCQELRELPTGMGKMEELRKLYLSRTPISEIPMVEGFMTKLETLLVWDCMKLARLPDSIGCLKKLEILDANGCRELSELPTGMGTMEELRELDLSRTSIREIPMVEGFMTKLENLRVSDCIKLARLPNSIGCLTKLKKLRADGCKELRELPTGMGKMEELRELSLSQTPIREIPMVEGFMTKLETLWFSDCMKLARLPDAIGCLTKLKALSVDGCISMTAIPESIGKLESLQQFDLSDTSIKALPESIRNLHNLKILGISGTPLKGLEDAIDRLKKRGFFEAEEVPKEILELTHLKDLSLDWAPISGLQNLPSGLIDLSLAGCSMKSTPNLSYLNNLWCLVLEDMDVIPELPSRRGRLYLRGCQTLRTLPRNISNQKYLMDLSIEDCTELIEINALEEAQSLTDLSIINCRKISKLSGIGNSFTHLSLESCDGLESLPDLSTLRNLRDFSLSKCNNIVEIQGLDTIECLEELKIHDCSSLERIENFSHLTTLRNLGFGNCPKLRDIPCIEEFTSLELLYLYGGSPTLKFPDLAMLRNLKGLGVINFEELREIPELQQLKSLKSLSISGCKSLENLPDFSEFTNLKILDAQGCEQLIELTGLENLDSFIQLYIFGCRSLKQLPMLQKGLIDEQKYNTEWLWHF